MAAVQWPNPKWLCLLIALGAIFLSSPAEAAHTQSRLLLATESARPGETVMAAVRLHMEPGGHTYWKNSGASGTPNTVNGQLPKGITPGGITRPGTVKF